MLPNKKRSLIALTALPLLLGGFLVARSFTSAESRHTGSLRTRLQTFLTASRAGIGGSGGNQGQDSISPEVLYEEILQAVKSKYVEENINEARLSNNALNRMFASLDDPKTNYLDLRLRQMRQESLQGKFAGIGAMLQYTKLKKGSVDHRNLTVVAVMPNSPAEKAGLQTGDNITGIEGRWVITYPISADIEELVKDKDLTDAQKREAAKKIVERYRTGFTLPKALLQLSTGEGKTLKVKIERLGATSEMEVTTGATTVEPVETKQLENGITYLRVRQFNAFATTAFQKALENLSDAKALVLDLRQNAGGVSAEASTGVDGFQSAKRLIATIAGTANAKLERKPNQSEALTIGEGTGKFKGSCVVLVDKGTANLAELVAVALQEAKKAKIIGTRTFGDPTLQLLTIFKNGTGVEMTTAHFMGASGQKWLNGIQPDIVTTEPLEKAVSTLGG